MRRAKIVATLGPSTETEEQIQGLIDAGVNVVRLNMSHGNHLEHQRRLKLVRDLSNKAGRPIGVFADLQGPKIRLTLFENDFAILETGQTFVITTDDVLGTAERAGTSLKTLTDDVRPGDQVLIDDGKIHLRALEVNDTEVITEVVVGGRVSNNKGINLPGVAVSVPALTEKDEHDLRWALRHGVDMVALSFVRSASDYDRVREIMGDEDRHVPVIAKIEKPQAVENLQEIIDTFDAIMVARGDLGVELPPEQVPSVQKRIIESARKWAKPVIVATQMLESMIGAPQPTRAETSDVANAILDGADAVMLSGETAMGQYPLEAVEVMSRIINYTEGQGMHNIRGIDWDPHTHSGVISKAAVDIATRIGAKYLAAFTISGDTPHRLARLRSEIPIMAFTPKPRTAQELTLCWGVQSWVTDEFTTTEGMVESVQDSLMQTGWVKAGDFIVIVAGNPARYGGQTNSVRIYRLHE
ncbi:MAG: pyruvate kinase [Micropruina sp.]|nr:pyruvate kinase [Micropruina sp.]